ncbi:MAG TPA: hypothetical protein VG992_04535, partial [Candidatus Saccharimonadales bacterium]|nr:hypothetical protein [Candidatus Saccharimonadales bacterium]
TNAMMIERLAGLKKVAEVQDGTGLFLTSTSYRCWLDIDSATAKTYLSELTGKRDQQADVIKQLEGRLANKSYIQNAPAAIVNQTKAQLAEAQSVLESIQQEIKRFDV